ncbi:MULTISPECIES: MFS transporter [Sphingobium]|jgi:MHS family proline/betaine transporter-like MFS transporter|uniref:MFS transporter n=1 Tax=Sphingobium TaxID=165695 RepID=UPI000DBB31DB|nr:MULTISPECIES: MFS transporter [Sphingobium]KAA9015248.1 MHS family MFS transporter [Sphingobium limneticum]MBU0930530.1 MFS transporter [Alphaproteobacteria bacterium]BBD00557.1 MFS transporter, MHS family, proline/betaine transporter [Sphingobium sp. YG1]
MQAHSTPTQPLPHRSLAVAALSTIVEWYDFTLYLYFATVLSRVFFGGGTVGLGDVLAGFAIAYLMRPVGAIVFGHIGDRYGRRLTMILSMGMMTAAMLATAMLPTHAQVGPAAGWMMIGLRCLMAFSVGGEYTGVVAYLLEGARAERRGLVTSLASAASEVGALLAAGVSALTVASLDEGALAAWGWRIPFLVGAALAGIILLARSTMEESPDFLRQQAQATTPRSPLRHSLRHHRAAIGRGFAISALGSISYYVGITYVPSFLSAMGTTGEADALWLSTLAALAVILVTPLTGLLTDRIGRRPVLVGLAIAGVVLPMLLFLMMRGGFGLALAGAVVLACLGGAVSAVGAVATAEQFPGEGRLSGLAFGATSATALFGGLTPWLAHHLVEASGWAPAPGAMIAIVALCVLPVLVMLPETAPRKSKKADPVAGRPF